MKVAMLSYPMLFQTIGGLQNQVAYTVASLNDLGCEARLIDPNRERLDAFDLIHVFSAINGNHRIVEHAHMFNRPCVLSPLLQPHWTRSFGARARFADRLLGRITRWELGTEYRQIAAAIHGSKEIIALGHSEMTCIVEGLGCEAHKISVIPNGVQRHFFEATGDAFCDTFDVEPGYVLTVASVDPYKNQLGVARALQNTATTLVVVGECLPANGPYLKELMSLSNVRYAGPLKHDDPLLAAAYAGASSFCLSSRAEVMPLTVIESLAAGTPVILTKHHCMDLEASAPFVIEVDATSDRSIRDAALKWKQSPPQSRSAVSQSVVHLTWEAVAQRILTVYDRVLASSVRR